MGWRMRVCACNVCTLQNDRTWHTAELVFNVYEPGVREVGLLSGGKDRQFWAGYYGVKMTDAFVIIDFENDQENSDVIDEQQ
jgi:hypothetical protein